MKPNHYLILTLCILWCGVTSPVAFAQKHSTDSALKSKVADDGKEIAAILTAQAKAWNEGNLEAFMQTYWKSDKLTFSSGGKTTRGWKATLENYRKSYAPPKEMGRLHFDGLEIMKIESDSALVLGNWHLAMKDNSKKDGNFSLVVRRIEGVWKIIHDHSSALEPKNVKKKDE